VANLKISDLATKTTPATADLIEIVDVAGGNVSKKAALGNLPLPAHSQTASTITDFGIGVDARLAAYADAAPDDDDRALAIVDGAPNASLFVAWLLRVRGEVNVLAFIQEAQHAAIRSGTSTYDALADINAAIAAFPALGGRLYFPPGVYFIKPTTTLWLNALPNVIFCGAGMYLSTIRVMSSTGNWKRIIAGATPTTDLSGLVVEDLGFDGNTVANTTATVVVGTDTTHQVAIYAAAASGNGVRVRRCLFQTGGLNTVVVSGQRAEVCDCQFVFTMRAANAQYDNSAIYSTACDCTIARNQFLGDSLTTAGHGAVTAIETHGGTTVIANNTCRRFQNMMNVCTGTASAGKVAVVGNVAEECNWGVQVWPVDSPGFDGLTIVANTFSLSNVAHNLNNSAGVKFVDSASATQPIRNAVIAGNTIRFADEGAGRTVDYASAALSTTESCGIGVRCRGTVTNLTIANNTVELAPGRGIVLGQTTGTPTYSDVKITGNILLNPGQNLGINLFQRHGISAFGTLADVWIDGNIVKDDFATTRCTYDVFAAPSGGTFTRVRICRTIVPPATTPLTSSYDPSVIRWDDTQVPTSLTGSATWNPPSLVTNAQQSTTVTVTGAVVGDAVIAVGFNLALSGTRLWGEVTAANTVTVYQRNDTGGTVDIGSGTLRVAVAKF
jgi:hypothetical protein